MRERRSYGLLALLLAVRAGGAAAAGWQVGSVHDPATDEERPAARVRSEDGFELDVYREQEGGRVLALLRMLPGNLDMIDGQRPPGFAVDQGPPQEASLLDGEIKWLRVAVWHGQGEPRHGLLRDLMEGSRLAVRYDLYGGGYKETVFPLAGAREAIAEVLGVRAEVSAAERQQAAELEAAQADALDACLAESKKKRQEACLAALAACSGGEVASREAFADCMAGRERD